MNSTDRLTRAQVDLAVRHLTSRFYDEHGIGDSELFDDFARKLTWQISGDNTRYFRAYLLDILLTFNEFEGIAAGRVTLNRLRGAEGDLNVNANGAIGAANIGSGDWINRYNGRQPAKYNLPGHEQTAAQFNALVRAGRFSR